MTRNQAFTMSYFRRFDWSLSRWSFSFVSLAALFAASPLLAIEVEVKNDSVVDGSTATVQAGFDPGESAAAWLTSPCTGTIVAVRVYWRSLSGGTPPSLEDSITIAQQGTFPTPGPALAFLEGPVLTDGVLNEYRYLDENNTIPISVPVNNNQVFVVSFRFDSNPSPFNGPSVVTDTNGCQGGKNSINANGIGWVNSCALGVSGDFMIRAVVDCPEATGACCVVSGNCVPDATQSECIQGGGTYQGDDSECSGVTCPVLIGACCKPDGSCQDNLTSSQCSAMSGTYQGNGSNCSQVSCPLPPQACCNPSNSFCSLLPPGDCAGFGGVPQGPGTTCVGPSSNQCPTGACCLPSGTCLEGARPSTCAAQGGVYQGTGVTCGQVSCPQPQGACCLTSGGCSVSAQDICEGFGHTWMGVGTDCADADMNGTADVCEPPAPPDGDMDEDEKTDGLDLQIFTTAVASSSTNPTHLAHGDFNGNNVMDVGDIAGMVNALLP